MSHLFTLAMKNLSRYRKRTIITASAIAFGLALFIFMDSWLQGASRDSEINLINYETSSAKIMHPEYLEERDSLPLKYLIEEPQALFAELDAAGIPAAGRIGFQAELFVRQDPYPQDGSLYVKATAIDTERDGDVYKLQETLESGRFLTADDEGVMLGAWLAEDLGAEVGYPLTLKTRTRYGAYETMELEVVGILNVPNPVINRVGVFVPLTTADYYLDMDGALTEVALRLPMEGNIEEQTAELREVIGSLDKGLSLHSWKALAPDYVAMDAMKTQGSSKILFLVFLIAAVGITNTMLMAVYERTRELGMMRAMGMTARQIKWTFLFEAAGIGLIGSAIGVLVGCLINWPMVQWGIDYSFVVREFDVGYRITGIFRSLWSVQTIVRAFFAGIVMAMIVALIPIRRALKMNITACLRSE